MAFSEEMFGKVYKVAKVIGKNIDNPSLLEVGPKHRMSDKAVNRHTNIQYNVKRDFKNLKLKVQE